MEIRKPEDQKIYNKITLDTRPRKDGRVKVIFRLKIDGVKKDYPTGVYWDPTCFDPIRQTLLPRFKNDPDLKHSNHKLQELQARAGRILLRFFVDNKTVSIKAFDEYFHNSESGENFFWFADTRITQLYQRGVITNGTYRTYRSSLNRLKEFNNNEILPLSSFDLPLIEEFNVYFRKKYKHNTVCGFHKNYKKILSMAVEEKRINKNPYEGFQFGYRDGSRAVLTQYEVKYLHTMLTGEKLTDTEKAVLRRFLFSCTTGIRISDTHRVKAGMIRDNVLCFTPYKTKRTGKILKIPLSTFSRSLIEGRDGLLFDPLSDKHINFCLKVIGAKADIDKSLTYHVSRDTFGTIFIELGGDPVSLKEIMGHTNIATTMIYVKMSDRRKQQLMNNFDSFLK